MPAHKALEAPVAALIVPLGAIVNTLLPLPPAVVMVAVPSQPGVQLGFVVVFTDKVSTAGSVIVTLVVPTQLFPSVAEIVYVPAHNALAAPVPLINGAPGPLIV